MPSRTYKPTDWKVWTYVPVAGKFRLDFSTLDGSDVLGGSTDTGSMQILDMQISSIEIVEGSAPQQSVIFNVIGGSATITGQLNSWNSNFFKELYDGKSIAITLKNESAFDVYYPLSTYPNFGKNTPYFYGRIRSTTMSVDPLTKIVSYTIECVDLFTQILNTQIVYERSTGMFKYEAINKSTTNAQNANILPSWRDAGLLQTWGFTTNESSTNHAIQLGEMLTEFINSELAVAVPRWFWAIDSVGGYWFEAPFTFKIESIPISVNSGVELPRITNLVMTTDGADRPTMFNISNSSASINNIQNSQNYLGNPVGYEAQFDVLTSDLQYIVDVLGEATSKVSPVEIETIFAATNEQITFVAPVVGWQPTYPYHNPYIGYRVQVPSTILGEPYYGYVVGLKHNIDLDNWKITYTTTKGLY